MNFTQVLQSICTTDHHTHQVQVSADWSQGRTLFGGLQTAIALHALQQMMPPDAPLRTLQVIFVAPLPPDAPITVKTAKLREGRSAIHGEARLHNAEGDVACVVVAVFGRARPSKLRFATVMSAADSQNTIETPFVPKLMPTFLQHFRTCWEKGCLPYSGAAEPISRVWMAHRDTNPLSLAHMVALADVIPTPAMSTLKTRANASSLTWSLDVLDIDVDFAPDALWRMDAVATDAADGYISQTATLFNPAGRAAAHARQTAVVFG